MSYFTIKKVVTLPISSLWAHREEALDKLRNVPQNCDLERLKSDVLTPFPHFRAMPQSLCLTRHCSCIIVA